MAEDGNNGGGRGGWFAILALVGVVALVAWLATLVPEGGASRFVYLVLLLAFLGGGLLWTLRRAPLGRSLRHAAIWLLLFGFAFVGYSFRDEAQWVYDRVQGDLAPAVGFDITGGEISYRAGPGGHFSVTAEVDGTPVTFLVDTGASEVVLTRDDARRLGLDPDSLTYSRAYRTANGIVMGAPVVLERIVMGPVVVENVRASVNSAPMDGSLLGMSFLTRTGGYRVEGDRLTIYAR